jgi:uncharacterized protein (TIGR00369 family)
MPEPTARTPSLPEQLARYADDFNQSQALKLFGTRISFPTTERVRIEIDPLRTEHLGGMGSDVVNGGVLSAAFDLAIGCTGALVNPQLRNATTQLSLFFERPLRGRVLRAEAWINSHGKVLLFSSAEITDDAGRVCARGTGEVRLTDKPWNNGHSPAVY